MGKMGAGYGSECHLLRFMGRHRSLLDGHVLRTTGASSVRWLDFGFDPSRDWSDAEWKGLDFLQDGHPAKAAWHRAWPQRGNVPNWDAVGTLSFGDRTEWLLVEAKANLAELRSSCTAKRQGGLAQITHTLNETKHALRVPKDRHWLSGYYQYCNRLAVLHFLNAHDTPAHLLFIYFTGDRGDARRICPADEAGWSDALTRQAAWVGLPRAHPLSDRIHQVFVPACPSV